MRTWTFLHCDPNVEIELIAGGLDDPKERRKERQDDGCKHELGLCKIAKKQTQGLLVEAMALLDDEGRVQGKGE